MKKQKQEIFEEEEIVFLQEILSPEEIFLLGYLKSFDRQSSQRWEKEKLWNFN